MEITPELITQYGLMNKISTGNTFVDIVFCLLVPLLLRHLVPLLVSLPQRLWPEKATAKCFTRRIDFTQRSSYYWYDSDSQPPNSILQRAVLNLINRQALTLSKLTNADVALKKKPPGKLDGGHEVDKGEEGSDCDTDDGQGKEHAYSFNLLPPPGTWLDLENGIRFMLETEVLDDKQKTTKVRYQLSSKERNGNERIAAFLQEALETYRKEQSAKVDPARYLYMPVLSGIREAPNTDGDSSSKPSALYKRYKLSEEKTFASFFHPERDAILKLVDQFLNKTGKFGIPGYPQKLGFLLYGPPGTGKTSMIKALAQYTKRSIISVPLSKISTNQELMDIVFDNKLQVQNSSESAISLPFEKTIFVMEDVDAASDVVQRRNSTCNDSSTAVATARLRALVDTMMASASAAKASKAPSQSRDTAGSKHDGEGSDDQDSDKEREEKEDDNVQQRQATAVTASASSLATAARLGCSNGGGGVGGSCSSWETPGVAIGPSLPLGAFGKGLFKGEDEINLAGLLNVLDGVVDTPNRIIIMTTNHPEKLDPALIRPGRINKKVYMGRLRVTEALDMMRHYYGPLRPEDEAALRDVFVNEQLSPADLEAMCAEYDTPAEMVQGVTVRLASGDAGFKPC